MGLSLFLAIIGGVIAIVGITLLLLKKQQKIAIFSIVAGVLLATLPYLLIYVFLD